MYWEFCFCTPNITYGHLVGEYTKLGPRLQPKGFTKRHRCLTISTCFNIVTTQSVCITALYLCRYCTFKLENTKQLDVSRAERNRVLALMENLSTVQQRSYTNPHDSHYPVIGSTAIKPALDRSREAEMRNFKMNGWSEYQAVYDRYGYKAIAWRRDVHLKSISHIITIITITPIVLSRVRTASTVVVGTHHLKFWTLMNEPSTCCLCITIIIIK